jgi:proteasome alpha subunit
MGGATEPVITALTASFTAGWDLQTALAAAVKALGTAGEGAPRELLPAQLEVAVLDRTLAGRTFRRVQGATLGAVLAGPAPAAADTAVTVDLPDDAADVADAPVSDADGPDGNPAG